jgi:hypothetical protein
MTPVYGGETKTRFPEGGGCKICPRNLQDFFPRLTDEEIRLELLDIFRGLTTKSGGDWNMMKHSRLMSVRLLYRMYEGLHLLKRYT